jgi:hypothetical protein
MISKDTFTLSEILLGAATAIGVGYVLLKDEEPKKKRVYKVRNKRKDTLRGSRDLEEESLPLNKTVEKVSSPNFFSND